jgi:TolB protein
MSPSSIPYFFISYSREDAVQQRRVVAELRERGINAWVDTENLIPGTPAWEREIERSIRGAAGLVVLLSPSSNNSEWVRREISFAEQNAKRIFPVMVRGDEDDSVPLRLSNHQRVDARKSMNKGMDELAFGLNDFLGTTVVGKGIKQKQKKSFELKPEDVKKFALPGILALIGLACVGGLLLVANFISNNINTPVPATTPPDVDPSITATATVPGTVQDQPTGKIIYTCQIQGDEICIINADGSGWRRLTNITFGTFNASLSPDGQQAVYGVNYGNSSEIHELDVSSGNSKQLTDLKESLGSPEISPDNQFIVFHYQSGKNNKQLWIMKRDGNDPHELYSEPGKDVHDGTWSPDGRQILFALGKGDNNKLYVMDFNGRDPQLLNDSVDTRGRSDWGVGGLVSLDQGGPFAHEVYIMNEDGSGLQQISPDGMNSQGASFSPDGKWVTFTAYTNVADRDSNSCEIFIMRVDGTDMRQLTNNGYCDYQPRWGN